jgi:hypothetical protein
LLVARCHATKHNPESIIMANFKKPDASGRPAKKYNA